MEEVLSINSELFLRVLRPYEAGALFSLVQKNREHLRQWLPWIDATRSPVDSRRFLELSYAGFLRGGGFNFGIRYQGCLVGVIGFHGFDRMNRVTSLGYWLSSAACGQGLMRQSVSACIQYAIDQQNMNRICLRCATGNTRSKRIAESLGFTCEGTQREAEWLYDHFVDLEMYSILACEWKNRVSA